MVVWSQVVAKYFVYESCARTYVWKFEEQDLMSEAVAYIKRNINADQTGMRFELW